MPALSGGIHSLCRGFPVEDAWLAVNRRLDRDAAALPNEALLVHRLNALPTIGAVDERVRWLTVARLAEMTLKLAGDYADAGDFRAAGDLLANPRRIDVYRRGRPTAIRKARHRALSEQFAGAIGEENPAAWLCRETIVHVRRVALLPELQGLLNDSGMMATDYLETIAERMCRVAGMIAFLSAWQAGGGLMHARLESATPADRQAVADHRCDFGWARFDAMGKEIAGIARGEVARSPFLRHAATDGRR